MESVSAGKIGKYEIIKVLGRGGMGEVLLAQDVDLGRRVAIKRPFKSALEDGLARFQIEARAATLRHPNIPAVYEMGEQDGLPFIAMEFVEGENLDKVIASGKQLDLITKLSIIEQVCSALGYAHEKGIIHRDIKPANVIVQPDGVAKIIDFGIAKIQDADGRAGLTQTSQVIGSLLYIAPERFKGGPIDGRVDIFSAGVTLFKLLTGREPFTGGEVTASYKIVNEAHTSLGAYLHDYPPALDQIIEKSLAKNPEDRYSTGEDFAYDLQEVIEELKRGRVTQLLDDAERLKTESRFTPALELLEEAIKLDPANTQARRLRKFVRENQDRLKRAERLRDCTIHADQALLAGSFEEALNHLKEAQYLDPNSTDIRQRIQSVEEKKRRFELSERAVQDADAARMRGDITGALHIVAKALQEDPDNKKLATANHALARQAEIEAQRARILEILEKTHRQLAEHNFKAAEELLAELDTIDPSNLDADNLRRELAKAREQEQRRVILDEIQIEVSKCLQTEAFDDAANLLSRAIEKFPNETMLHRLRADVDTEAHNYETKRLADGAISQAKGLFENAPLEALAVLQKALERLPGEERLLSYERSLRQQLDTLHVEQLRAEMLLKARESMAAKQFDKAVGVLESFQLEFGQHAEVDDLLGFARDELANQRRSTVIERCTSEGRRLIREGRPEDAITLLEYGIKETGDEALSRLLAEVREQQVVIARKLEQLHRRVRVLEEHGELGEAIRLLEEQLAATPENAQVRELLTTLVAEREHKQAVDKAIALAREAAKQKDFPKGLESLKAVENAFGESPELTQAMRQLETERAAHAQEVVGNSIDAARAALLQSDPQGALAAMKSATKLVEFADPKKQADWNRIGQSVKKALQDAGAHDAAAALEASQSGSARPKSRQAALWAIASGCVVLAAVVAVLVLKIEAPPRTQTTAPSQIEIVKAPPGATVTIDNGPAQLTNANGELMIKVAPGQHELAVSKEGFELFTDTIPVGSGETVKDSVRLTPLPPAGTKTGTFSPLPPAGLARVRVFVNGESKGEKRAGEKIVLPVGTYTVKYAWQGFQDSKEHTIHIASESDFQDRFTLDKALPQVPATGRLTIQTTPGAHVVIDGYSKGPADSNGNYTVEGLPAGQHSVDLSLEGYQSQNRQVTVAAGQVQPFSAVLTRNPVQQSPTGSLSVNTNSIERGQSVTLTWQVNNASAVAITEIGAVAPQGSRTVSPSRTTTFQLTVNGATLLSEQTVDVREPRPQVQNQSAAVAPSSPKPQGPDRAALEGGLNAYKSEFARASGKNTKECQGILNGAYKGKLHELAAWCGSAKSFEVSDQCSQQVGGTPESPNLTCSETRTIIPKDGDPQKSQSQRTFQFAKSADGSWQISGW
jgi:serine/threonine-protein kinase